jgi:hypothetical protein
MSRGLGRVERAILDTLAEVPGARMSTKTLVALVFGTAAPRAVHPPRGDHDAGGLGRQGGPVVGAQGPGGHLAQQRHAPATAGAGPLRTAGCPGESRRGMTRPSRTAHRASGAKSFRLAIRWWSSVHPASPRSSANIRVNRGDAP